MSVYAIRDKRKPEIDLYVGSTCVPMCVRFAQHILNAFYTNRNTWKSKLVMHMHDEGVSNFEAYLLENCEPDIRRQREQFHMDRLKPEFHMQRAFGRGSRAPRTEAQKEKRRTRRRNDPFYRAAVRKAYHEKYKFRIAERSAQKVTCSCGATVSHGSMWGHLKSKKHISLSTQLP